MASPVLVARAGVGSWTSIKYLLTRGLDIGTPPVTVQKSRRTLSQLGTRMGDRQVQANHNG